VEFWLSFVFGFSCKKDFARVLLLKLGLSHLDLFSKNPYNKNNIKEVK